MTKTRSTSAALKSRRRFLKVAVMGSAAVVASSVLAAPGEAARVVAKRPPRPKPPEPERASALQEEIAKQKKSTADAVKTIRDYELPAGSEMAFAFVPAKAPKRGAVKAGAPGVGGSR